MSAPPPATVGPTAYWYLTRATGVVSLLLLTLSVGLGVLDVQRFSSPRWPRFVVDRVHRDASLLAVALLVVHILTSVLDGFAPIRLLDAVLPFVSAYRPVWLGLGALGFDLLVAVLVTSLVRRQLGYRAWRAVHWLAYASWPVAAFHTLGTGSDARQGWLLALTVVCVLAVVAAAGTRILRARTASAARAGSLAIAAITPVALTAFALLGPLAARWAERAGTPLSVLRKAHLAAYASTSSAALAAPAPRPAVRRPGLAVPFTAQLSGTLSQTPEPGGALVDLVLACTGSVHGELRVRMAGQPVPGGGLSMIGSQVAFTAVGLTSAFQGTITLLEGRELVARVTDASGRALRLHASLSINSSTNAVTGTLTGASAKRAR